MQMQQQAQQQAAAQAGQAHDAALAQQGAQFRMGLQQSAYDQASGRNLQSAEFQAHLDQAPQLAQQHAELSAWVNNQEMTQADNMRLQRLQSALSSVMGDDTLTVQEKADYALHLKTGIDPLKARQERSQIQHQEQQNQILMDQHKRNTQMQDVQDRYNAQTAQERMETVVLSDGTTAHFMPDGKGGKVQIKSERPEHLKHVPWESVYKVYQDMAEEEADRAYPPTRLQDAHGNDSKVMDRNGENLAYKAKVLERMRTQYERDQAAKANWKPGQPNPVPTAPMTVPAASMATSGATSPPPPPAKKFDLNKLSEASEPQQVMVKSIEGFRRLVAIAPNLPPELKAHLDANAQEAAKLIADNGSVDNMLPEDKARFTVIMETLRASSKQQPDPNRLPNRPAQSAPAPSAGFLGQSNRITP